MGRRLLLALRSCVSFERSSSNIAALDGLRGIAILLVLGRHAVRVFYSDTDGLLKIGGWEAASPFINGWIGVDLFFVLSGFLITYQVLRRRTESGELKLSDYLLRRVFRILPTYLAVLLLVGFGLIPLYSVSGLSAAEMVRHLTFLQDYGGSRLVPAFWSLGVEEKFYLLAPFLLAALLHLQRERWRFGLLAALLLTSLSLRALTFISQPEVTTYEQAFLVFRSPFHLNLDGLAIGVGVALAYDAHQQGRLSLPAGLSTAVFWAGAVLIGCLLCLRPLVDHPTWFNATLLESLLAAGFGSMVFGLVFQPSLLAGLFGSRMLFFAALISYPLYLIHMTLIPLSYSILESTTATSRLGLPLQFALFLPIFVAVSIAAALYLHLAVERPFLLIRDRLLARRRERQLRAVGEATLEAA